jgi:hypothetical protein
MKPAITKVDLETPTLTIPKGTEIKVSDYITLGSKRTFEYKGHVGLVLASEVTIK